MNSKHIRYLIASIAAFVTTYAFGLSYYWENVTDNTVKTHWERHLDAADLWNQAQTEPFHNIFFLILFGVLCYAYNKTIENVSNNRRLIVFAGVTSAVCATSEIVGHSFAAVSGLDEIFYSFHDMAKSMVRWVGYAALFFACISFITIIIIPKLTSLPYSQGCFPRNDKKTFVTSAVVVFVFYGLFVTNHWPAILNHDTLIYISQEYNPPLTNHHAIFNTWIITPFIKLGLAIGNVNIGVFFATLIQIAIISVITAYAIVTISKFEIPKAVRIGAAAFYVFYPAYAYFAISIGKDTPFGYATLVFVLCLLQIGIYKEMFFKKRINIILFIVSPILMMLHRNNGFHILILSMPFLIWWLKGTYRWRMAIYAVGVIVFNILWSVFIYNICGIQPGSEVEKYSLISQQLSRIARTESISDNDKTEIEKYIKCSADEFGKAYYPEISDATKILLDTTAIKENLSGLLGLSVKMMLKYPKTSFEGFFNTTYSYWHIQSSETMGGPGTLESFPKTNPITRSLVEKRLCFNPITELLEVAMFKQNIPVIIMLFRNGFIVWIMIYCFGYCWYTKRYNLLLMYVPLFATWLVCIASPYNTFRYMFGIATSLPVLISTLFVGHHYSTIQQTNDNQNHIA